MVDFGEELMIVERYRIPWLIWIQILVFFLLLLLLYVFGVFSSDLSDDSSSSSSRSSASAVSLSRKFPYGEPIPADHNARVVVSSSRVQSNQTGRSQSMKGEIASSTRLVRGEDTKEDSSRSLHHPCHFIQLARSAFLKCLGLGRSTYISESTESKKER